MFCKCLKIFISARDHLTRVSVCLTKVSARLGLVWLKSRLGLVFFFPKMKVSARHQTLGIIYIISMYVDYMRVSICKYSFVIVLVYLCVCVGMCLSEYLYNNSYIYIYIYKLRLHIIDVIYSLI